MKHKVSSLERIFSNFEDVTDQEWREKIEKDIKGHFQDLLWQDENKLVFQPYYRRTDMVELENLEKIQTANQVDADWQITQLLNWATEKPHEIHESITKALDSGADRILLKSQSGLNSIENFLADKQYGSSVFVQQNALVGDELPSGKNKAVFLFDPIADLMREGSAINLRDSLPGKRAKEFMESSNCRILVDGSTYKNAGCNQVQEIAFLLQHAVEYLDFFTEKGFDAKSIAEKITIKTGIGTSFFSEIAKIRTLRFLWNRIMLAYGIKTAAVLIAEASSYYLSITEPYNNLLRLTTQLLSASFANCNFLASPSFDLGNSANALFSQRMARNIQLILKNECYANRVVDPSAGSYYVEALSAKYADAAWEKFTEMEKGGGLQKAFGSGSVQDEILAIHQRRLERMKEGKIKVLGVNIHREKGAENPVIQTTAGKKRDYLPLEERNLSESYFRKQEEL